MVPGANKTMASGVYEDQRCAICHGICGERHTIVASNHMFLLAVDLDVYNDFVHHEHVAVHCGNFANGECLRVAFGREQLLAFWKRTPMFRRVWPFVRHEQEHVVHIWTSVKPPGTPCGICGRRFLSHSETIDCVTFLSPTFHELLCPSTLYR